MKKVLICISGLHVDNGIAKVIMNYYESLVENGYNIDFLEMVDGYTDENYAEMIRKNGGKIYVVPKHNRYSRKKVVSKYVSDLLLKKSYDIIHVNLVNLYAFLCIKIAKKSGIKHIIYHIHNPKHFNKTILVNNILNNYCINNASKLVACTTDAGKSVFGRRNFEVINNTIDVKEYCFSHEMRKKYREDMKIDDKLVIGVVARKEKQKNPFFIIDIFKYISEQNKNCILLWIGKGSLDKKVENYAKKKHVYDKVKFLGFRKDVKNLYSCMDVFLLPSRFEGLGIVFIEAQAFGLPTYTSTNVPKDVNISDLIHFISLKEKTQKWGDAILNAKIEQKDRAEYNGVVCNTVFNKENNSSLVKLYDKVLNEEKIK